MNWTQLRFIQVEAIHEVLDGRSDLVISARTAAGKEDLVLITGSLFLVGDTKKILNKL